MEVRLLIAFYSTWIILGVCIDYATAINGCAQPYIQYCKNCDIGPNCIAPAIAVFDDAESVSDCNVSCSSNLSCSMAVYKASENTCYLHNCSEVDMDFSATAVRQTCNADCLEYEIFIFDNHAGPGNTIIGSLSVVNTLQECIAMCIDMPNCRGAAFEHASTKCRFHSSSNEMSREGYTFIKKRCMDEANTCNRNYTSTCLDCKFGPQCQAPYVSQTVATVQDCDAMLASGLDAAITAFYNPSTGSCRVSFCSQVTQRLHTTLLRRTCSQDCPEYRIFILEGYNGTCQILGQDAGGVTLEYCLEKCLDMAGCRGVSYSQQDSMCTYHDCDSHQQSTGFFFVKRDCTDTTSASSYTQTCLNCGSECFNPISSQPDIRISTHCNVTCDNCQSTMYEASEDTCYHYQCDYPSLPTSGGTLFRKTANPDCLKYQLFPFMNQDSTCGTIDYEIGGMDPFYCIVRCLDIPFCRASKYDSLADMCSYHSCANHANTVNTVGIENHFVEKICIDDCASPTTHVCYNCEHGPDCQSDYYEANIAETLCTSDCNTDSNCEGAEYKVGECRMFQCNEVGQQYNSTFYRKTCNVDDDCPFYEIYTLDGHYGFCDTMWVDLLITLPYLCMKRCIDTPGCRGVTYDNTSLTCTYHGCDCSVEFIPKYTFMWRYCISGSSNVTILPPATDNTTIPVADIYPKAQLNCFGIATSTSLITSSQALTAPLDPINVTQCYCSADIMSNMSSEVFISIILAEMKIDTNSLSSSRRRRTCAQDNRSSSKAIGGLGAALLISTSCIIIAMDLLNSFSSFKNIKTRILNTKGNK